MLDLLNAEWRRFRGGALGVALLHWLLLVYLGRLTNLPQQSVYLLALIALVYAFGGLLFGAWQMQGHRQPAPWLCLMHRPLAPARIGLALSGAGAAVLATTVLLPLLLALPVLAGMGHLVEGLHLGLALQAWLAALCGYLCGAAALLGPLWRGLPLLAVPLLLLFDFLPLPWLLLPLGLADAWLLALLLGRFRPDLAARPRGAVDLLLQGLPLIAVFAALLQLGLPLVAQGALALAGRHPSQLPDGDASLEAWRVSRPDEQLRRLLPALPDGWLQTDLEQARQLRLRNPGVRLEMRHQPGPWLSLNWSEPERGWRLQFKHARMQYRVDDARGRPLGWLGPACLGPLDQDAAATGHFAQPPRPLGPGIAVGARLMEWQSGSPCLRTGFELREDGDALQQMLPIGTDWLALSTRGLWHLKRAPDGRWQPRWQLPLPGGIAPVDDLMVLRHPQREDWLVRLLQIGSEPAHAARVDWYRVDAQGHLQRLAGRSLQPDYPAGWIWSDWIAAPLLQQVRSGYEAWLARTFGAGHLQLDRPSRDAPVLGLALLLSALALALSAWLSRRRRASQAWLPAAALAGLPALLVQLLLQAPRRTGRTMPP